MTMTITTPAAPSTTPDVIPSPRTASTRPLWRTGLVAGLVAAAATVAIATCAQALDVSLETAPGEAISVAGFGQLTLFFTAVGVAVARVIGRRARSPRSTFTRTTVVLTALSLVPDVLLSAQASTKVTLMLTHLVAAAIVIPALSSRLPERACR